MRLIQRRSAVERVELVRESDQPLAQVVRQLETSSSGSAQVGVPGRDQCG